MKTIKIVFLGIAFFLAKPSNSQEKNNNWKGNRPDGHAPISVMGDHYHGKGEIMLSYRYMYMNMEDIQVGINKETPQNILRPNGGKYMVTPTKMPMNMHMLGAMYAPSNKITLLAMLNYIDMNMDHITAMGGAFTTASSGFGDTKVGAIFKLMNKKEQVFHTKVGLSLPTGTINNRDVTPASNGNAVILPYPMQIGSGTFDTDVAITYLGQKPTFSWGNQLQGTFRFGKNSNNYRLGNRYDLNNWIAVKASKWVSISARLQALFVDKIEGANPALNPNMIITANTNNSGGSFLYSGLGVNFYVPKGAYKNLRVGLEYSNPIYQNVNGTQLRPKETITVGLQYSL